MVTAVHGFEFADPEVAVVHGVAVVLEFDGAFFAVLKGGVHEQGRLALTLAIRECCVL